MGTSAGKRKYKYNRKDTSIIQKMKEKVEQKQKKS